MDPQGVMPRRRAAHGRQMATLTLALADINDINVVLTHADLRGDSLSTLLEQELFP